MNCKFCGAELEEGNSLCPTCGRDNAEELEQETVEAAEEAAMQEEPVEEEEAPAAEETEPTEEAENETEPEGAEMKPGKKGAGLLIGLAVALALVVGVALFFILRGTGSRDTQPENPAVGTEGTTAVTEEATEISGKLSQDDEAALAAADQEVARMGDAVLTNRQLQIYYWSSYYSFLQQYGAYASYFGLDTTKPLDQQTNTDGITWHQYFLDQAVDVWRHYEALRQEAQAAGVAIDSELQKQIDDTESSLTEEAVSAGFESLDAMIQSDFGVTANYAVYKEYLEQYYTSYTYMNGLMEAINPSREELSAFFDENPEIFTEQEVRKDETPASMNVRHILIAPEGGTTDENGQTTYSDEEWAAAEAKAKEILDSWDGTEDGFAALANEHSTDPGSNTNGGLYEGVTPGQMVTEFNDWCFDPARTQGDTGIVRTNYGYHIMYFVSASEEYYWETVARNQYLTQKNTEILEDALAKHAYTVSDEAIVLAVAPSVVAQYTEETEASDATAGTTSDTTP